MAGAGAGRRRRHHVRGTWTSSNTKVMINQFVLTAGCAAAGEAVAAGGPLAVRGRRPGPGGARGAGCPSRVAARAVGRVRAGVDTCRGALRRARARALGPGVPAAARPCVQAPARTACGSGPAARPRLRGPGSRPRGVGGRGGLPSPGPESPPPPPRFPGRSGSRDPFFVR